VASRRPLGLSLTLLLALLSLAVVLGFAVARPRGSPEAFAAVPAVLLLLAVGAISVHDAAAEAARLLRVVAFLGAVLVLAKMCDDEGLFEAAGAALARAHVGSHRLLRQVFVIAATITAVLSLDATVVLLTPVVLTTVRWLREPVRPHAYATAHLANAASLLLPVSNLTNLLAFHVAALSFIRFTLMMALPWLAAVAAVYVVFRWFFRGNLSVQPGRQQFGPSRRQPVFALVVVALRLAGFVITEAAGVAPAWAALAGASVMAVRSLGPSEHVGGGERARGERAVLGIRAGVGHRGAGRHAQRIGRPDGRRVAVRFGADRAAGYRSGGRRAGQYPQQSARDPGVAAPGGDKRAGGDPGRADRGEHRPQLDLCRLAVESAGVACYAATTCRPALANTPGSGCAPSPRRSWRRCWRCGPVCGCWGFSGGRPVATAYRVHPSPCAALRDSR
jgi:hypothetical protein